MKRLAWLICLLGSVCVLADDVRMAFGEKIPPFCFPKTNSGIELEIIGAALAYKGHVLKPFYYPFARVPVAFKNGQVDAAMTDLGEDLQPWGAHYGDPAVIYQNVFFTLASRKLSINKPADLNGLTIVSFAGAVNRYPQWLRVAQKAGRYIEQNDQSIQVKTLMKGRYDVVLSDVSIFRYFSLQLKAEGFELQPVSQHPFTAVNPQDYRPVFRSQQVRDDFNLGLAELKKSGRYQAIYDKYLRD